MPENFFIRLREYYLKVVSVMKGEADSASIFPNPTDIGQSREKTYSEFLRLHAPSKCNVFLGGFLFDHTNGEESRQIDVIVTTDTTPRFNLHNRDGSGKSFSPVEGTLCVVSNKSNLNKNELEDALAGIASIPPTQPIKGRLSFGLDIKDYDDWPLKIVFATSGVNEHTLLLHLSNYYKTNPEIPVERRPNLIHVVNQYVLIRTVHGLNVRNTSGQVLEPELGKYVLITRDSDLQGIIWALNRLQEIAIASSHILYNYTNIINAVNQTSP